MQFGTHRFIFLYQDEPNATNKLTLFVNVASNVGKEARDWQIFKVFPPMSVQLRDFSEQINFKKIPYI